MPSVFSIVLGLAAFIGSGSPPPVTHKTKFDPIPPQFQYNRTVTVVEMNQDQIDNQCGKGGKDAQGEQLVTIACGDINGSTVYVPNPCLADEVNNYNSYAHLLCHEIAHTEGWVHKE